MNVTLYRSSMIRWLFLFMLLSGSVLRASENIMMIIIDGARYTETLGDASRTYTPKMWELSEQGTVLTRFYNDSMTYTARAIPALWCGTWTEVRDTVYHGIQTSYAVKPTIFEYYRKQLNRPSWECFYILKYITSLWLSSFNRDYGTDYWPTYHSVGRTDAQVCTETENIMNIYHPPFLWVYLADVDAAGHSGDWNRYTDALAIADSIVYRLWDKIRKDEYYQDRTTLFVTNDHGRHDNQHGGFTSHGCGCEGCRHIQFLALGPEIRKNFISSQYRRIPDFAVTAGAVSGFTMPQATGEVMSEIFMTYDLDTPGQSEFSFRLMPNYPNPFNSSTAIRYRLESDRHATQKGVSSVDVDLSIYDVLGRKVITLIDENQHSGIYNVYWNATDFPSGIYYIQLSVTIQQPGANGQMPTANLQSHKILLIK